MEGTINFVLHKILFFVCLQNVQSKAGFKPIGSISSSWAPCLRDRVIPNLECNFILNYTLHSDFSSPFHTNHSMGISGALKRHQEKIAFLRLSNVSPWDGFSSFSFCHWKPFSWLRVNGFHLAITGPPAITHQPHYICSTSVPRVNKLQISNQHEASLGVIIWYSAGPDGHASVETNIPVDHHRGISSILGFCRLHDLNNPRGLWTLEEEGLRGDRRRGFHENEILPPPFLENKCKHGKIIF